MYRAQKLDLEVHVVAIALSQQASRQEIPKMQLIISDDPSIQRLKMSGRVC